MPEPVGFACAAAIVLAALGLGLLAPVHVAAEDVSDLRSQIEAQNELIRRQAEALERMGDRVRILEDEHAAAPHIPQAAGQPELGGLRVAEEPWGSFNFKFYTYVRYLNQKGLDDEYTDAFGRTTRARPAAGHPAPEGEARHLRLGDGPEAELPALRVDAPTRARARARRSSSAGFLQYKFDEAFSLGGGITALPGTRTTLGNFPQWLSVDNRFIADEFFRPSYTSGIWATAASSSRTGATT